MPLFIIHGESQMLGAESGMFLQTTDEGLAWVDASKANDYFSPKEGKDEAVLGAMKVIENAKVLMAKSGHKLSKFIPEWLLNFMNEKDELDEDSLRRDLHAQEIDEKLSDSELIRFYIKTDGGWVAEDNNSMGVGHELCWGFSAACAFISKAGALAAIENMGIKSYAIIEAKISFLNIQKQSMKDDDELLAMSSGIERSILEREISKKNVISAKASISL